MGKYIFSRIIKAIFSIFAVVSIVIGMIFTLIPKTKIFELDEGYRKLKGDSRITYTYSKYDELGYLDFVKLQDMCNEKSDDVNACLVNNSGENLRVIQEYEDDGYTIEYLKSKTAYAYRDYTILELVMNFWSHLIKVDTVNAIQDSNNPNLERKVYFGKDQNGAPAIKCSGCEHEYLLYFGDGFPFVHQNFISLNFGNSYPTNKGIPTLKVINQGQGEQVKKEQTFPTGLVQESAINQHTCTYKNTIDHLDETRFTNNYANCDSYYSSPSMVGTSYKFGIISLVIAYVLAIPFGILMSRNKDKAVDKIGIAFINIVIALPSLALIFFIREIGVNFGLPDKFPMLGFNDVRSYIAPIIVLSLISMPSLMMWTRRYMIDQSTSDYVKFARAKGLSQKEIFNKHILKNAIIPIVNGIPVSIVACISGAFITESAFAIPGMGKMLPEAIKRLNNNMVITLVFIFSSLAIFSVLVGDLLMTAIDPRIQLAVKKGKK